MDYIKDRFNNPPNELSLIGTAGNIWRGVKHGLQTASKLGSGEIDPSTPEGAQNVAEAAFMFQPMSPAFKTGGAISRIAEGRPPPASVPVPALPANVRAAQTAVDIGAPLPVSIASGNRATQSIAAAARQFPGVGTAIDERVAETAKGAGDAVGELGSTLAGGPTDRATVGASLRPSLQDVIHGNNAKIDQVYSQLRNVIDPDAVAADLPRTRATLDAIVRDRTSAGQQNPTAGLENVKSLVDQGASFNGLQRARSDIGNSINFGQANPGFNKGDLKRVYGAMSADMENVVGQHTLAGIDPSQSVRVLQAANSAASQLIQRNQNIQKLVNIQSDEGLAGSLIKAGTNDKTGNLRLLAQLRQSMPSEDFDQIAGVAVSEMGHDATGHFSLAKFGSNWSKMDDPAKAVLLRDPSHAKFLDDIASLSKNLKHASQYENTSNSGRSVELGGLVSAAGGAAAAVAMSGDVKPLLALLGSIGGGYVLAKWLARPAGAATVSKWMRAADSYRMSPSPTKRAAIVMATRNMLNTMGVSPQQLLTRPESVHANDEQQEPKSAIKQQQNPTKKENARILQGGAHSR